MPVLIIGAAGLVGRHVRAALAGRETIATYRREPVPGGIALDVTDADAVRALIRTHRPEAIVLAAAAPFVEGCERDPLGTRRVNVEAGRVVRDAASEVDAALVVFSSEYVFDGTAGAYDESMPTSPLNEYGRQKVALEELAREWPRHLILRVSGVFGDEPARKNFALQLADRLSQDKTFDVPSDQLITPTDAESLALEVVALLDTDETGTFHAAGPEIMDRVSFAQMAARAFGLNERLIRPRPTDELDLLAPRPRRAGLSDAKLRATLGRGLAAPADALRRLAARERTR